MTVAIQGGWGTGKTSALTIIEGGLDKEFVKTIWFETWPYASLGRESNLIFQLMNCFGGLVGDEVAKETMESGNALAKVAVSAKSVRRKLAGLAQKFAQTAGAVPGNEPAMLIGNAVGALLDDGKTPSPDELRKLKDKIGDNIKRLVGIPIAEKGAENDGAGDGETDSKDPRRMVVFVDDLDRLEPARALELLEGIKNFIDCRHCVFVIAVDDRVVREGIAQKYKFGDGEAKEYTRHFFDKIIQVPFRMREDRYDLAGYIREEGFLGEGVADESIGDYVRAIDSLDARNPRSIKRAFNLMSLYLDDDPSVDQGLDRDNGSSVDQRFNLFIILLLQMNFPDTFAKLLAKRSKQGVVSLIEDERTVADGGFTGLRGALGCEANEGDTNEGQTISWSFEDAKVSIEAFAETVMRFAGVPKEEGSFDPKEKLIAFLEDKGFKPEQRSLSDRELGWFTSKVDYVKDGTKFLLSENKKGGVNFTMYEGIPKGEYPVDGLTVKGEGPHTVCAIQDLDESGFKTLRELIESALEGKLS